MSELQLALVALAAVLLVALFAYSKWQERRTLREFSSALREGVGDALLDTPEAAPPRAAPSPLQPFQPQASASTAPAAPSRPPTLPIPRQERVEPQLTRQPIPPAPDADERPHTVPPTLAPHAPASSAARPARDRRAAAPADPQATIPGPPAASEWVEDPLLDFAVELRCAHAVDGVAVYDAATRLAPGLLPTPVHLVVWDARAQQWLRPDRFGFYSDVLVAAQLASRRHVLGEPELGRLIGAMQQVALALDADFDPPDPARVAAQGSELDRLCSRFDVRIGLTLQPLAGSWASDKIRAAALAVGLTEIDRQHWLRADESGQRLFTLAASGPVSDRLLLELDVPTAPVAADPLRQLFAAGQQLGEKLGAHIVDDNGRPIESASVASIEAQLARLYAEMRAAGIEPAGLRAQRLYG